MFFPQNNKRQLSSHGGRIRWGMKGELSVLLLCLWVAATNSFQHVSSTLPGCQPSFNHLTNKDLRKSCCSVRFQRRHQMMPYETIDTISNAVNNFLHLHGGSYHPSHHDMNVVEQVDVLLKDSIGQWQTLLSSSSSSEPFSFWSSRKQLSLPQVSIPFQDSAKELFNSLSRGQALGERTMSNIPDYATSLVLDSLGRDTLIFLAASVVVTLVSNLLGMTPILGYLLAGALLGPHCLNVFLNAKADIELGDFGILFLLFSEGLDVSSVRLQKLAKYLPLGFAQIVLCTGIITATILMGIPEALAQVFPLDQTFIDVQRPVEALIVAIAGTLSTSAFVFPVLKERGWEEERIGEAATSILLLQDLAVAPLLVLLPYLVGDGATDYAAIGFLTAKAVFGFGLTLAIGRSLISQLFSWVAKSQSSETFVALSLLVAVGMGTIAKALGLTDTAGAFAAGVILANSNYRAQIQADILPFKGILLGIFFMDAGSTFDSSLFLHEFPTIAIGALSLLFLKFVTLLYATKVPRWMEPNQLPPADGMRLSVLLAGGGEFAFVVLALSERLKIIPHDFGGVLTAIVLITMGLTPALGDLAEFASKDLPNYLEDELVQDCEIANETVDSDPEIADDAVVILGYGTVGNAVLQSLGEAHRSSKPSDQQEDDDDMQPTLPHVVIFDADVDIVRKARRRIDSREVYEGDSKVIFGNGCNPEVVRSTGIVNPSAIFITYREHKNIFSAATRLRSAFPKAAIFTRAKSRKEARSLKYAGVTETIVESDELGRSAASLIRRSYEHTLQMDLDPRSTISQVLALETGLRLHEVTQLLDLYDSLDPDCVGSIQLDDIGKMLSSVDVTKRFIGVDDWLRTTGLSGAINRLEFCCLYERAPPSIRMTFDHCIGECQSSYAEEVLELEEVD